jgi:outer membrane receptor protein involved in Fe transport
MLLIKIPRLIVLCALSPVFDVVAQTAPAPVTPPASVRPAPKEDPVQLSVFEVTTSQDIGYQSTNAAEVTRMNTAITDIPMNVTVLNQQFIEDTLARKTEDVLEYVPGFVPTSNNDSWSVRGFANANTKFLNGFLQQESIGTVSVANVERVEVLKGPAAVLFGQGGFAATVNRVTKRPRDKAATSVRGSFGPLDSWRAEVDTTGPIGGRGSPFAFRITGVWDDGEYYRKISHKEKAFSSVVSWQIAKSTRLTLEQLYVEETDGGAVWRQPMFRGDPRGFLLADGTFLSSGDNRQGFSAPGDIRVWKRGFAMADLQHAFNRNVQLRVQFAHDVKDQLYDETQPEQGSLTILKDAVLMPKRWRVRIQDVENLRLRSELLATFKTGPASHRALFGYSWDDSDGIVWNRDGIYNRGGLAANAAALNQRFPTASVGSRFNQYPNLSYADFLVDVRRAGFNPFMIPPVNAMNPGLSPPVPGKAERPPLPTGARNRDTTVNHEFYLADVVSFMEERLFVTGGLRHTRTDDGRFNTTTNVRAFDNDAKSTTFSTGVVYHLNREKSLTFYANANSSFIPEFQRQPDGDALKPQEGKQKEAGLRFSLAGDRIQGLLSVYEIQQRNVTQPDPNRVDYFVQLDGIRSRGTEFTLNARFTDAWSVMGGYSYNDSRDTKTRVRSIYAPYHMFTAFNKYAFRQGKLQGLDVSLGSIYIGERPIDPTPITTLGGLVNTPIWTMSGEWRFDVVLRYALRTKGRVQYVFGAKLQNALDNQDIFKLGDTVSVQRQPGRTVQFSVSAKF